MEIQGFTKGTMATERRALVNVTLGWQHVYEFELWIMDHGAGVDVVLGTDFMIPAGVRLDMFHATARLPDEVSIPLIKTLNRQDDRGEGPHVTGGPTKDLLVPSREFAEYRLPRVRPPADTHEPSAVERPAYTTPTRIQRRPDDDAPTRREYVNSTVHFERGGNEQNGQAPPADEAFASNDGSEPEPGSATTDPLIRDDVEPGVSGAPDLTASDACLSEGRSEPSVSPSDPSEDDPGPDEENPVDPEFTCTPNESSVEILERLYVSVATVLSAEVATEQTAEYSTAEHTANTINLEDYAHELAFLPDLTEALATELDYSASNVRHPELSLDLQEKMVRVLKQHEKIMISSGNALPPPAYGVVCDIDVQGHPPIKQKARRVPLRHLKKLYELLKGLLKAGLVSFSTSPWASPIVIVLKKN
ncbi:hypothetical protein PR003_g30916, partial [Phytophthora rubi]